MICLLLLLLPLCWGIPMHTEWNGAESDHDAQAMTSSPAQINPLQNVLQVPETIILTPSTPSHGAFINTNIERTELGNNYVRALRQAQLPTTLLDRYEHELLALGLLLLVPVTLGVVELAEAIGRHYSDEAYPERGRERLRWDGRARHDHLQKRSERENRVHEERRWWRRCRRADCMYVRVTEDDSE